MEKALTKRTKNLIGMHNGITSNISPKLWGDITELQGDISPDLRGEISECYLTDDERRKGVDIKELVQ